VRQDLSLQDTNPCQQVENHLSRKTWPDGCLGLPRPDEFCTRALVEGWRITLSDGRRTWVYRTDSEGRVIRLQNQTASANTLTAVAMPFWRMPLSRVAHFLLRILKQNDGLGQMAAWDWAPGVFCTACSGWQ